MTDSTRHGAPGARLDRGYDPASGVRSYTVRMPQVSIAVASEVYKDHGHEPDGLPPYARQELRAHFLRELDRVLPPGPEPRPKPVFHPDRLKAYLWPGEETLYQTPPSQATLLRREVDEFIGRRPRTDHGRDYASQIPGPAPRPHRGAPPFSTFAPPTTRLPTLGSAT